MTVHSPSPWGQSCHSSAVLDTPSASDQWPQPSTQGLTTSVPLLGSFKGPPKEWQSWSLALFFSLHLPLSNTILGKSFILSKPKSFEYTLLTWMMILELRKLSNLPDVTQLPRGKSGLLESEETFGSYLPVLLHIIVSTEHSLYGMPWDQWARLLSPEETSPGGPATPGLAQLPQGLRAEGYGHNPPFACSTTSASWEDRLQSP